MGSYWSLRLKWTGDSHFDLLVYSSHLDLTLVDLVTLLKKWIYMTCDTFWRKRIANHTGLPYVTTKVTTSRFGRRGFLYTNCEGVWSGRLPNKTQLAFATNAFIVRLEWEQSLNKQSNCISFDNPKLGTTLSLWKEIDHSLFLSFHILFIVEWKCSQFKIWCANKERYSMKWKMSNISWVSSAHLKIA